MLTRHKRLHVNALMAQRPVHELHEVPQVMGKKRRALPMNVLPLICIVNCRGRVKEGEVTQRLTQGEQFYLHVHSHCFCGFMVANPIVLIH